MGENSSNSNNMGCVGTLVGISAIVATFQLGPMDFARSVYNQIVGDTPVLKRQLVEYAREGVMRENPGILSLDVEKQLAKEYNTKLFNGIIDPQQVPIDYLWEATETYSKSAWQHWMWPSLD